MPKRAGAVEAYGTDPNRAYSDLAPNAYIVGGAGLSGAARGGLNDRNLGASGSSEGRYPYDAGAAVPSSIDRDRASGSHDPESTHGYDARHYDMLKNHHMNLLQELQQTTNIMNAIRRKHEQRQQDPHSQQSPPPQAGQNPGMNPSSQYSSYPPEIQSQLDQLSNLHHPSQQRPSSLGRSPMRATPSPYAGMHATESLLGAMGAGRRQHVGTHDRADMRRQPGFGTDPLSHTLDRMGYNDAVNPRDLAAAESALLQQAMERKLSNPAASGVGGRLADQYAMNPRDRIGANYNQYGSTAGIDSWSNQQNNPASSMAGDRPDFSDSLFAAQLDSATRRLSDASRGSGGGNKRLSDASRSSYHPFPQQESDLRLQPSRPSQEESRQKASKSLPAPLSKSTSEDLAVATSLKDLQRRVDDQQVAGAKRDASSEHELEPPRKRPGSGATPETGAPSSESNKVQGEPKVAEC